MSGSPVRASVSLLTDQETINEKNTHPNIIYVYMRQVVHMLHVTIYPKKKGGEGNIAILSTKAIALDLKST